MKVEDRYSSTTLSIAKIITGALFLILALFFFCSESFAVNDDKASMTGCVDMPKGVFDDSAGDIYIVGYTQIEGTVENEGCKGETKGVSGTFRPLVLKYTTDGTLLWAAEYNDSTSRDPFPSFEHLVFDSAQRPIVCGRIDNTIAVVSYDTDGNELWDTILDGGADEIVNVKGLYIDSNDNLYVLATFQQGSIRYPVLAKLAADGTKLW